MSEAPIIVFIGKDDPELYNRLKDEPFFKQKNNKDLFLIAMAYGYRNSVRKELAARAQGGFFRTEYLQPEDWALINSLAIETESVEILKDSEKIIKLAEEFAHGGIRLLIHKLDSTEFGSFDKKFELEMLEMYNKLIGQDNEKDTSS